MCLPASRVQAKTRRSACESTASECCTTVESMPAIVSIIVRLTELGVVDILFHGPVATTRVGPHHVWTIVRVHSDPHVVAQEAGLKWVVRWNQVGHGRCRDACVVHPGRRS